LLVLVLVLLTKQKFFEDAAMAVVTVSVQARN
jgi:hypothetical protein